MRVRELLVVFIVLISAIGLSAQKPEEIAKQREDRRNLLLEQVRAELPNIRLGENKIGFGMRLAAFTWKTDRERGREMYIAAADELLAAQASAEAVQKRANVYDDLVYGGSLRMELLNAVAERDAELALDLLVRTRPAALARALAERPAGKVTTSGNNANLAQNERQAEQRFLRMAAEQNPERMINLLKAALAKSVTPESLENLRKLHEKDPAAAREFAGKIVDKLLATKFVRNDQTTSLAINCAMSFVNDFIRERSASDKSFRFDEGQMRPLAEKIIAFYLDSPAPYLSQSLIRIADKLSPTNVAKLREQSRSPNPYNGFSIDPGLEKLMNRETPVAEVLAAAKKGDSPNRYALYENAISKLAQQGDLDSARAIATENYEGEALENAMLNIRSQESQKLQRDGRFADAERTIDELPENFRRSALIGLAGSVYVKDPEANKAYAAALINKVRATLPERPESREDMSILSQVIAAYLNIKSDEAFAVYEQLIPQANNLASAAAVLQPFQGNRNMARNGELIFINNQPYGNFGFDLDMVRRLAEQDFDRAARLIDAFDRPETRVLLRLQLAETLN